MKDKKYFILTIISILALSVITYQQFKGFREISSEIDLPEFKMPEFNLSNLQENTENKEFISPDNKLRIEYPSSWLVLPKEGLENLNQEIVKINSEILFFAQKFNLQDATFISLAIQKLHLEEGQDLETVIYQMEEDAKKEEKNGEILQSKINDKNAYLETRYKKEGEATFITKEKAILHENEVYIITFIAQEKNWSIFEEEVEEIFNSIQFNP